ncbi:unnamed protein product [Fusarium graminearum]|uniref:Chromosome 1, complete genome n=1 Tax=Gibberella zeae (strain ATCC MYA-4620 / CBS 123657 / FGSC 9075 / NRRL 31084 / PH-1) TaxID=229533 RepID=A0A098D9Q6_GIBZE|nr:unnamed protein product [Fusarium graminearum]CZS78457.1 unnamed protein product [Fusarium graminearum]
MSHNIATSVVIKVLDEILENDSMDVLSWYAAIIVKIHGLIEVHVYWRPPRPISVMPSSSCSRLAGN